MDDEDLERQRLDAAQKLSERQRRMRLGVDDRIVGGELQPTPDDGDLEDDVAAATASAATASTCNGPTLLEREAAWGFSLAELHMASKVVKVLFHDPALFVGDPYLAESRLYTMISRDRKAKKEHADVYKKIMSEEKLRKTRAKKAEDAVAIRKTTMKTERDAALAALLLPPPPSSDDDDDDQPRRIAAAQGDPPACAQTNNGDDEAIDERAAAAETIIATTHRQRACHICHERYRDLHHYYYSLCLACAEFNYAKRFLRRDLSGRNVLLTGCRIKIGYAMSLSLLRCGATLIGTTRFVHDGLRRFMEEPDYASWRHRLHLYAIDLRDMWMVTQFAAFLESKYDHLFAIINNAAQTIARTVDYTAALRHFEANPVPKVRAALVQASDSSLEWMQFYGAYSSVRIGHPMELEQQHPTAAPSDNHQQHHHGGQLRPLSLEQRGAETDTLDRGRGHHEEGERAATESAEGGGVLTFAKPRYDRYDTQAEMGDVRTTNSWTTELAEVRPSEAAEVMAINALSPMILNAKLKPLLMKNRHPLPPPPPTSASSATAPADDDDGTDIANSVGPSPSAAAPPRRHEGRFIINVSAMEGQFYRFKQTTHPHTNMAKAALNMMTRTSAADYAKDDIYMNAVDTGWITDESPVQKKQRRDKEEKLCPLDEVDAAARCLDPIYMDSVEHGKFWKDFKIIPW